MAKFYGSVGYGETKETAPGVWEEDVVIEKKYYGDILQSNRRLESGEQLNDDINVSNKISIIADPFAYQHFFNMRYVNWMGARWKITNVEVQQPRLILSIGGVYNGPIPHNAS